MRRRVLSALVMISGLQGCGTPTTHGTEGPPTTQADESAASTQGAESSTGPTSSLGTTSSPSSDATSTTVAGSDTAETSGGEPGDAFTLCSRQTSEAECEAVDVNAAFAGLPPSECGWVQVYPLLLADTCGAERPIEMCILFSGFLAGCGGFGCGEGVDEQVVYFRAGDSGVGVDAEALFRPTDICGPEPLAPADELQWQGCQPGCPQHPACTCLCDSLGLPYEVSKDCE